MINSCGLTEDTYHEALSDTAKYGPHRVELAKKLMPWLNKFPGGITWFLDSGTLLGAYRDGKMLLHDDDFDLGFYLPEKDLSVLERLNSYLQNAGFNCRIVDTYCTKVEIFNPEHGKYMLNNREGNPDFHNVTVDITMFVNSPGKTDMVTFLHNHAQQGDLHVPLATISTLDSLVYEGHRWPVPRNTCEFLEGIYGYIGHGAVYNPDKFRYEKGPSRSKE